ncbi:hypothetical protein BO71DRAFT_328497, partial [Aspergillus ellipticus CBS 707.79]
VTGMLGNTYNLVSILKWQANILDNEDWNNKIKYIILEEIYSLAIAFNNTESAYTREHGLKETRKAIYVDIY